MNTHEKAKLARAWFELKERESGEAYWAHALDDATAQELALAAHGDGAMLPDDTRYSYIVEALESLSEHEDEEDAKQSLETDKCTHDLVQWLGSHGERIGYCDEALEWKPTSMSTLLMLGQLQERLEVFDQVVAWLEEWQPEP